MRNCFPSSYPFPPNFPTPNPHLIPFFLVDLHVLPFTPTFRHFPPTFPHFPPTFPPLSPTFLLFVGLMVVGSLSLDGVEVLVPGPRQHPAQPSIRQLPGAADAQTAHPTIPPPPAQPRHTNHWAPRTRKRHQQEHQHQRPAESNDPTQHVEGRTGDCPGPRKETTTQRNVTRGAGRAVKQASSYASRPRGRRNNITHKKCFMRRALY